VIGFVPTVKQYRVAVYAVCFHCGAVLESRLPFVGGDAWWLEALFGGSDLIRRSRYWQHVRKFVKER
jgi:hypothetical protein